MKISDFIKVFNSQDDAFTQVSEYRLVHWVVVEWKNALYILPFVYFGCDSCTSLLFGQQNEMVEGEKVFGFEPCFDNCVFVASGVRLGNGI